MTSSTQIPRVGVGVFVLNAKGEFVFGRRAGSHGAGTWSLPGGHLELYEDFEDCARREVLEETGMEIEDVRFLTATNSPRIDGLKHYVTIFLVAKPSNPSGQPQNLEPEKCEGWEWINWNTMLEWVEEQNNSSAQKSVSLNGRANILFEPMINLVQQRPGCRPSLS